MKQSFFLCICMMILATLSAQTNAADETAIKKIIQQQQEAWNRHDWPTFSSYYADDATLINFVGQFWEGREKILEHFQLLSACCLEPTSLKFEVREFRFLNSQLVIVYTKETLFADRDYDVPIRQYKKGDIDHKWRIDVFVRKDKEWKVTSTQMTLINQLITPQATSRSGTHADKSLPLADKIGQKNQHRSG